MSVGTRQSLDERLEALFESRPEAMEEANEIWREVREASPAYEHGPTVLVTRYEDVKAAIKDGIRLSNKGYAEGSRAEAVRARLSDEGKAAFDEVSDFEANFITRTDGERHERLRGIVHRVFTPRRIAAMHDTIQGYTDELLAHVDPGAPADLAVFAYELPLMAICDMCGVPREDHGLIHDWALKIARNRGGVEEGPLLESRDAGREFRAYVADLADRHRRSAGSGGELVATLLDATEGDRLTDVELAGAFVLLLFAGHETTTSLVGAGLYELLREPDQYRLLADDPGLVPAAIDELLRFVSPVQWLNRFAVEEHEIGGVEIPRGQTVMPVLACANRDPSVFPDPDRLDIRRPESKQSLAFGFGAHYCLGVSLARLEGEITFRTLAERFPRAELAADSFEWAGNSMFRRIGSLPVTLAP
jgi:cytochrome P450